MADNKDEIEARRWFRRRLAQLGRQYPELKNSEHQQRLTEALEKDDTLCPGKRQADPEADHQEADN